MLHAFAAENAGDAKGFAVARSAMPFAQALAQLRQQGVVCGTCQIIHFDQPGALFATGCAHSDEQGFLGACPGSHGGFGRHVVAGVDHGINGLGQQSRPVVGIDKIIHGVHAALRVKGCNARLHGQNLGLPQCGVVGVDLPVDV